MSNPLLSIIIPVYNEYDRIKNLLELLKKQDNPRLEIIAVDDGSTDNSYEILKGFIKAFYNFKCFKKENGGSGSARNYGLSQVSGKYVYFLDADDTLSDDMICTFFSKLDLEKEENIDLLVFGYQKKILKNGKVKGVYTSNLENYKLFKNKDILSQFYRLMGMDARLSIWNKIFRYEVITNHQINFPERKRTEDMFFFLDYIKHGDNITVIKDILYYHSSYYNISKLDKGLIINHIDLYEKLRQLLGKKPNQQNTLYLLNMFISWFTFVIPLNIYRNNNLNFIEKKTLLNELFNNDKFLFNLKNFNQLKSISLNKKLILSLLNLKSPSLLLYTVKFSEMIPREKIKKIMRS